MSGFLLIPMQGVAQVAQDETVVQFESSPSIQVGTPEQTLKDLHEILQKQLQERGGSPEGIKAHPEKMQLLQDQIREKEKMLRSQTEGLQRYSEEMQKRLRAPSDFGPADWGMGGVQFGGGREYGGGAFGGAFQSGRGDSQSVPRAEPEVSLRAINLSSAIPENMLSMVRPMLGPNGVFSYDARSNVVILVAPPMELERGAMFIEQLSRAYGEALKKAPPREEEFSEDPGIQAVRIEALLLKGEDEVSDATVAKRIARGRESQGSSAGETELPQEALNLGPAPEDLSPFAFPSVTTVGAAILQTQLDPSDRGGQIQAKVGEYRFSFRNSASSVMVAVSYERTFQVRTPRGVWAG